MEKLKPIGFVLLVLAILALGAYIVYCQPGFYLFAGKIKLAICAGALLVVGIIWVATKKQS